MHSVCFVALSPRIKKLLHTMKIDFKGRRPCSWGRQEEKGRSGVRGEHRKETAVHAWTKLPARWTGRECNVPWHFVSRASTPLNSMEIANIPWNLLAFYYVMLLLGTRPLKVVTHEHVHWAQKQNCSNPSMTIITYIMNPGQIWFTPFKARNRCLKYLEKINDSNFQCISIM